MEKVERLQILALLFILVLSFLSFFCTLIFRCKQPVSPGIRCLTAQWASVSAVMGNVREAKLEETPFLKVVVLES